MGWSELDFIDYVLEYNTVFESLQNTQEWLEWIEDIKSEFDGDDIQVENYLKSNKWFEMQQFIIFTPKIKDEIYKEFLDEFKNWWYQSDSDDNAKESYLEAWCDALREEAKWN